MAFFKCRDYCLPLGKKTYIMGILNVTPDSFFDGGKYNGVEKALEHASAMEKDGADIIDIGAQSTRPGYTEISAQEEIKRLEPILKAVRKRLSIPLSVDTYYAQAAEFALENGADIINDVSGTFNKDMAETVKKYNAGWIITHTGGIRSDMQKKYENGVIEDIKTFFRNTLDSAVEVGICSENLCFDVGIGFGKSREDNFEILEKLQNTKSENALMVGVSRKRFLQKENDTPEERLRATIEANTKAIKGGVDIIRVHDVKECADAVKVADTIYR